MWLPASVTAAPIEKPAAATVVLTGDLMLARRLKPPTPTQVRKARSLLGHADLVLGNLETPLGPCLDPGTPEFPRLCASKEMIEALPALGFTGVSMANNHMLDAGLDGLHRSRRLISRMRMTVTRPVSTHPQGSPVNSACPRSEAVQVSRFQVNGHELVLLAINATVPGRPPSGFPPPVTPAQVRICTSIHARRGTVIASIHHGREYAASPTRQDAALVRAAVQGGARIVVGHHPHVPRRAGWIEGAFVAWSLGNFASDQRSPRTHRGLLLRVVIDGEPRKKTFRVESVYYRVVDGWPVAAMGGGADQ